MKVPLEESFPRYNDQGFNFYYNQEDYLCEVQKRRGTWGWNVIRPNAINGFAPHGGYPVLFLSFSFLFILTITNRLLANGMSEVLTIAIYMLICRELGQPANFPGNEYFWNSIDDNSYAPSLADLSVWTASQDHCKDEAFNHVNGDVFVWKHIWKDFAAYFGLEVCYNPHTTYGPEFLAGMPILI